MKHKNTLIAGTYILCILSVSFFTYFRNYSHPPNLFWDENYHIAAAQKYINGVFFMEPHPPLGKLIIALGEYIVRPNSHIDTRSFLTTDYIKDIPVGYSFSGVRLFPALFASVSAVLFFLILKRLSRRSLLSFLFTSLYLFENALIVHNRGAMLESIQLFFVLSFILYFLKLFDRVECSNNIKTIHYVIFGLLFGLVMSVKLNGFMCIVFFMLLALYEESVADKQKKKGYIKMYIRTVFKRAIPFIFSALAVFIGIYYLHFIIAQNPVEGRYYEAQQQYKKIIDAHRTGSIVNVPYQLMQNISYIFHYEKGVPKYDYCKEGENGSLPITWPFGAKGINYRWSSDNGKAQYLYLQGNPANWFAGLAGVFLAINILTSVLVLGVKPKNKRIFTLITAFLMFYLAYMASMLTIERVMYLYHYFIPLIASFFLFYLVLLYLFEEQMKKRDMTIYGIALGILFVIILAYFFFSPLTYYLPLTRAEFQLRNWFSFWGLVSVL